MFERCLYFNLNALVRKVDRIWTHAFKDAGLSPAHAYLLRLVLAEPDITQSAIAEELHLEKSTVTRFIDALEEKGYLRRSREGREVRIRPTAAARRLENALNSQADALYAQMTGSIGRADLIELVRRLRQAGERIG